MCARKWRVIWTRQHTRLYCTKEREAFVHKHHTKMWKLQIVSNRNFLVRKSPCGCDYITVSSRTQVTRCLKIKYLLKNSDNGLTPCSNLYENPTVSQRNKKFHEFMKPGCSLPCSQQPVIFLCPQPIPEHQGTWKHTR